jgi:hypothetical protein
MAKSTKCVGVLFLAALQGGLGQQQPALQITSPAQGTVTTPGQTLSVAASASLGVQLTQVGIFGTIPLGGAGPLTTAPYQFTLDIPIGLPVGLYQLTAVGLDTSGNLVTSAPVAISVEPGAAVVKLSAQPTKLKFQFVGQQLPLIVTGTLSDGTIVDLAQSSATTYSSNAPQTVTVSHAGLATAVGGSGAGAAITVQRDSLSVSIPVSVPTSVKGDLNGDGVIDLNDLNIITLALNTPATKPADARDLNGDGVVNALDSRILVTLCARPGCATH